nr:MAG TPA: hypothetical protein [Caudoviricetes sp.]
MFGIKTMREQLVEERRKNAALQAQVIKANSDIEYLAMMADIEMEQDDEQEEQNYGEEEQI